MTDLLCLYEGVVIHEEVDNLGHMNVRFYATRAQRATHNLLGMLGLGTEKLESLDLMPVVRDAYTRHYREQLEDAPLQVDGGVIGADLGALVLYHELSNPKRAERAATFRHVVELHDRKTHVVVPFPKSIVARAASMVVGWPDHGRPRSLNLEAPSKNATFKELEKRGLGFRGSRTIDESECDVNGFIKLETPFSIPFGPGVMQGKVTGVPVFETDAGSNVAGATMESRQILVAVPRVGDQVKTFGAVIHMSEKTSVDCRWTFNLETEELLYVSYNMDLALDLTARRATVFPPHMREAMAERYHPDLA